MRGHAQCAGRGFLFLSPVRFTVLIEYVHLCRVKKLRETLVAVQQLDKNMSSLRSWLAHIETELSKPIAYDSCDFHDIQRKLDLQQVTSVQHSERPPSAVSPL